MKTYAFTILLRGWTIKNHKIFQLKLMKIRACNPSKLLYTSNHRNMEKWPEMVAREGPKIHQKSPKVNPGTLQGSSVCIFTQLDHQNASQGHPYDRKRSSGDSNSGVYPAIVRGLQVSTLSGQLNWIVANPAYLQILHSPQVAITRGAGGRGEALGYI